MEAYLQGPDGEEVELTFGEPDPADGTYVIQASEVLAKLAWYDERNGRTANDAAETFWIRIVPDGLIQPGETVVLKLEDLG